MVLAKKFGLSFVLSLLVGVAACAETAEYPPPVTPPPPPPARTEGATPPPPATAAAKAPAAPRVDTSLIPRDVLFGNPDRSGPQLSHDGKQISFLAPVDGVMNVWVGPAEDPS